MLIARLISYDHVKQEGMVIVCKFVRQQMKLMHCEQYLKFSDLQLCHVASESVPQTAKAAEEAVPQSPVGRRYHTAH